ncbi:chloramphenical resistance permease RarD [Kiloniella litopenaei]|uniref:Chloramphenical resistance permease RarD n=1 Tax=Kiloniella litopenaei TaxID=1549748 RepID=A0A0M2QZS9_9PROT|nr:EamA family transporter RarD [Kiloniella litopenaei]KKJ75152.1 chloramphenical resistance permease RarD [Kiloniella litopenaei]
MTRDTLQGFFLALAAFLWWGLTPLYFKLVEAAGPLEVLSHRVIWSLVLLAVLLLARKRWPEIKETFSSPKIWGWLLLSALLIAVNWLVFIWSISNGHLVEASLGYYINPLVNVLLGVVILGERLKLLQGIAVALAAIAVGYLTYIGGEFPWIALVLAMSFGFYGLIRKRLPVGAQVGLFAETAMVTPIALGYLIWIGVQNEVTYIAGGTGISLMLMLAGVVTTVPLVCFAAAARRLNYSTIGMIQYVGPTVNLLLATLLFGEAFTMVHAISFGLIWFAVFLFSTQSFADMKRAKKQVAL